MMRCPDCGFELNINGICNNCSTILQSNQPAFTNQEKKLENYESFHYLKFNKKEILNKAIHSLEGLLTGIHIDNKHYPLEIGELKYWCDNHQYLADISPFNEILSLLTTALDDSEISTEEYNDILWVCNKYKTNSNIITADIQQLHGLIHGIICDNKIEESEIIGLQNWLHENDHLRSTYPYDELSALVTTILQDGSMSIKEHNILKAFFSDFIDDDYSPSININELKSLKEEYSLVGICTVDPEITFDNSVFCFTGASSKTSRKAFAEKISSIGGKYKDNISPKTDYLIIGNEGNPCWAFSCYGRKVESAIKLRKLGCHIMLIHENDFWDAYMDLTI